MNINVKPSNIPDYNDVNAKHFLLDPLSVIIKLSILSSKPVGTKLSIKNNIIYFQEPGIFQGVSRMFINSNKTDIQYLYNPLNIACCYFLSDQFIDKYPQIKNLFLYAQNGIKKLLDTYKNCPLITITLNYYYILLSNHINQTFNDTMFIKDGFTSYYTDLVKTPLMGQWSEEQIQMLLNIMTFLSNNVDSLETYMGTIDLNTLNIINEIF